MSKAIIRCSECGDYVNNKKFYITNVDVDNLINILNDFNITNLEEANKILYLSLTKENIIERKAFEVIANNNEIYYNRKKHSIYYAFLKKYKDNIGIEKFINKLEFDNYSNIELINSLMVFPFLHKIIIIKLLELDDCFLGYLDIPEELKEELDIKLKIPYYFLEHGNSSNRRKVYYTKEELYKLIQEETFVDYDYLNTAFLYDFLLEENIYEDYDYKIKIEENLNKRGVYVDYSNKVGYYTNTKLFNIIQKGLFDDYDYLDTSFLLNLLKLNIIEDKEKTKIEISLKRRDK